MGKARHLKSDAGAAAVEYGLLLAGVAAVVVIAILLFGGTVIELFTDTCDEVATQTSADCTP